MGGGFQPQSRDCRLVSEGQEQVGQGKEERGGPGRLPAASAAALTLQGLQGSAGCVCDTCGMQLVPEK